MNSASKSLLKVAKQVLGREFDVRKDNDVLKDVFQVILAIHYRGTKVTVDDLVIEFNGDFAPATRDNPAETPEMYINSVEFEVSNLPDTVPLHMLSRQLVAELEKYGFDIYEKPDEFVGDDEVRVIIAQSLDSIKSFGMVLLAVRAIAKKNVEIELPVQVSYLPSAAAVRVVPMLTSENLADFLYENYYDEIFKYEAERIESSRF